MQLSSRKSWTNSDATARRSLDVWKDTTRNWSACLYAALVSFSLNLEWSRCVGLGNITQSWVQHLEAENLCLCQAVFVSIPAGTSCFSSPQFPQLLKWTYSQSLPCRENCFVHSVSDCIFIKSCADCVPYLFYGGWSSFEKKQQGDEVRDVSNCSDHELIFG